jgi:hypothetical protein
VLRDGTEAKNEAKTYVMDVEISGRRNSYYSKFMTELRTKDGTGLKK